MVGGWGQDSTSIAVGHAKGTKRILDLVREVRPPFSPEQTVKEFSEILKRYRCHTVRGDRWAGDWPKEKFSQYGINYEAESRSKSRTLELAREVEAMAQKALALAQAVLGSLGLGKKKAGPFQPCPIL
jgi:hypothetical protein